MSMLLNVYIYFRRLLKFVFLTLELLFSFPVKYSEDILKMCKYTDPCQYFIP